MRIIHEDFRQWSDEWYQIRFGRIGSSEAAPLLVNGKGDGGIGAGMRTLIYKKAAELLTAGPVDSDYTSPAMERGIEMEPLARQRYAEEKFCSVQQVGYISLGDHAGYSPDGLIGEDGLIELKCPGSVEYVRFFDTQEIDASHLAQMQWGLFVSGRQWCDYVVYNPDFRPDMVVVRVWPDEATQLRFMGMLRVFEIELKRVVGAFREAQVSVI